MNLISFKNKENLISLVLITIIFLLLTAALSFNWYQGKGDNATYADITLTIAKTGQPKSQVLSTIIDYIFKSKLVNSTPEEISGMTFPLVTYKDNVFRFHLSLIQYLIAPFSFFIPINVLWSLLTASSYLGMLYLFYHLMRKNGISILASVIFLILLSAHPAWNQSLFGQMYVDKLFLLTGTALILFTSAKKPNILLIALAAVLSSLINEKFMIISGIFLISYALLYWTNVQKDKRVKILSIGIILFLSAILIIRFYLDNSYYQSFLSISSILNFSKYLQTYPNAYPNLLTFLLVNLLFLMIGVFNWRTTLITLAMLIPNIFGNLGGAEKVGWQTHYHIAYFPFLAWTAILGYKKINNYLINYFTKLLFSGLLIIIIFLYFSYYSPNPYQFGFSGKYALNNNWLLKTKAILQDVYQPNGLLSCQEELLNVIKNTIPQNSTVSAPEDLFVYLFQNYIVYYYPLGLNGTDYVIVRITDTNSNPPIYSGFYSYLGSSVTEKINKELSIKLRDYNYDIFNPVISGDYAIIKHRK